MNQEKDKSPFFKNKGSLPGLLSRPIPPLTAQPSPITLERREQAEEGRRRNQEDNQVSDSIQADNRGTLSKTQILEEQAEESRRRHRTEQESNSVT